MPYCSGTTKSNKKCKKKVIRHGDTCSCHSTCPICYETVKKSKTLEMCNHRFCEGCIKKWILINDSCPICRTDLSITDLLLCYTQGTCVTYDMTNVPLTDTAYFYLHILEGLGVTLDCHISEKTFRLIMAKVANDQIANDIFQTIPTRSQVVLVPNNMKQLNKVYKFNVPI